MKKVLITSYDLEIGGVERSLISMLENFNYHNYEVDLMLFAHKGELMKELTSKCNLLPEMKEYSSLRKPIKQVLKEGHILLALARVMAKLRTLGRNDGGIYQMQLMWKYSLYFLPRLHGQYDIAISYLWPHYFVKEKVKAKSKIAWIHTDYSSINTNVRADLKMWKRFNYIVAVSQECKKAFTSKYPTLKSKVKVVENLTSPNYIKEMAKKERVEIDNIQEDTFKVLTVGRLSKEKGIDNAITALSILHDKNYKNIKWYVVGYGDEEENLKKLIEEKGLEESFVLLGKQENPYKYIKWCDLYVQPSRYEGKAVTVTEAKVLGKPILITNYPTSRSQVENGRDGLICELSPEGLAEGIEKLYNNPNLRKELGQTCKNRSYSNRHALQHLYKIMQKH